MIAAAVAFALLLGAFVFLVLPNAGRWQRAVSALIFVLLVGTVYAGSVEMLSRPKPLRLEWRDLPKANVLGASISEGKAIYVWLQMPEAAEPRAYVLPWNTKTAEQLQKAMRQGQATGTGVEVSNPFDSGRQDQRKPKFYAPPQRPLPDKLDENGRPISLQQH